ncbi:MAG: response regulator transcription factor [Thermomicrobiaceae bacterium]|nr:response regulator transcription factor [Thermomicrobiaceae bacterium]
MERQRVQSPKRRVLVVDDHPLFRQGLRRLIEDGGEFQVVAEAASGHEAIRQADIHNPDLVLMDIQLPGITGLNVARILKKQHPSLQIVILSMHIDDERLFEAMRAGASAFLTKDIEAQELISSLKRVCQGEQIINIAVLSRPGLAWRVLTEFRQLTGEEGGDGESLLPQSPKLPLSVREIEVLDCVAQGLSNKEIAEALFITEQTVKNHMTSVLRKLEVSDRVQAVLCAVKNGWIEVGPPTAGSSSSV